MSQPQCRKLQNSLRLFSQCKIISARAGTLKRSSSRGNSCSKSHNRDHSRNCETALSYYYWWFGTKPTSTLHGAFRTPTKKGRMKRKWKIKRRVCRCCSEPSSSIKVAIFQRSSYRATLSDWYTHWYLSCAMHTTCRANAEFSQAVCCQWYCHIYIWYQNQNPFPGTEEAI